MSEMRETSFAVSSVLFLFLVNESFKFPTSLYETGEEFPCLMDMQDIFSTLTKDSYIDTDYLNFEKRNQSDSLFERIYKDYCTIETPSNIYRDGKGSKSERGDLKDEERPGRTKYTPTQVKDEEVLADMDYECVSTATATRKRRRRQLKDIVDDARLRIATNINDNRYLWSPYITLRQKKHCSPSFEIVNPADRARTHRKTNVYKPHMKSLSSNHFSHNATCVCAFCGCTSSMVDLGSLYGPYFIEQDSVNTLPLTRIFPFEVSDIDTPNESSDNDTVEVIRLTDCSTMKTQFDDFRVTWDGEVWMHRECVLWAPGTFLRGDGKIGGLDEALKMALSAECFRCRKIGAILNCTTKNCEKNFHYLCAVIQGSKLNGEQFSVLCNEHKDK